MAKIILLVGAPTHAQVATWAQHEDQAHEENFVAITQSNGRKVKGKARMMSLVPDLPSPRSRTLETPLRPAIPANRHDILASATIPNTLASVNLRPPWRILPLHQDHLTTNLTQRDWLRTPYGGSIKRRRNGRSEFVKLVDRDDHETDVSEEEDMSFLTATSASPIEDDDDFFEHSFALHTATTLDARPDARDGQIITSAPSSSQVEGPPATSIFYKYSRIKPTPLAALPTASYILRSNPATITAHLVVGLITLHEPRRLQVRRTGRAVDLVEAIVGDESGAGFVISLWIDVDDSDTESLGRQPASSIGGLKEDLEGLKNGDVLLLQNVALAVFRGRVHGQSLGRGKTGWKGRTSAKLLWRRAAVKHIGRAHGEDVAYESDDLDNDDTGEMTAVMQRTKIVRDWVLRFIALPPTRRTGNGREHVQGEKDVTTGTRNEDGGRHSGAAKRKGKRPASPDAYTGFHGLPPDDTQ